MKENNYWKRLLMGEVALLLVFWGMIWIVCLIPARMAENNNNSGELVFPKLSEKQFVSSDFEASNNLLNRVDVMFKNPNLESRDELTIAVKTNNEVISQKNFSGFNFGDTSRARLDFGAIADSMGKDFTIEISTTKIVDGKLAVGVRNGKLDTVLYYQPKLSLKNAFNNSLDIWGKMISKQIVVVLLPMILVGLWLW